MITIVGSPKCFQVGVHFPEIILKSLKVTNGRRVGKVFMNLTGTDIPFRTENYHYFFFRKSNIFIKNLSELDKFLPIRSTKIKYFFIVKEKIFDDFLLREYISPTYRKDIVSVNEWYFDLYEEIKFYSEFLTVYD